MALRNFIHRRNHKERSQLTHRKKLGLLEKHKDYVLRAKDHHSKRDRIKRLREKALDRNKDEFYFGMIKGRVEKGVHYSSRGNEPLSSSIVSLLKTQDAGYVRRQVTSERKRIESLVAQLAPNVPEMRVEWLEEKSSRMEALRASGLLADDKKGKGKGKGRLELSEDKGDGKVGSQGKRTIWCDGGADGVRSYAPASASTSATASSSRSALQAPTMPRSIEDYDLEDLDDELLLNEGQLTDLDDDEDGELAPVHLAQDDEEQTARRRRRAERHWSYLLSLLRARQKRLEALTTASERLGLVRALMANKGGSSVRKIDAKKQQVTDMVAKGKYTKNGLALPGTEDSDEDEEDERGGKKKKEKVVYKFGKERKRFFTSCFCRSSSSSSSHLGLGLGPFDAAPRLGFGTGLEDGLEWDPATSAR